MSRSVPPARQLPATQHLWRVGLLGAGYIAEWHCRALRQLANVEIAAVCDHSAARAAALARLHSIPVKCTTVEALFDGTPLDVVHVLLPPEAHFTAARQVLEKGAHVLLEKPMCLTLSECEDLENEARRRSLAIGVSHNFLFYPIYERLKHDVERGELGPLDHVSVTWHKELPALRTGPSGSFALRGPANIMLEVGPHVMAHALDLVGIPEHLEALAHDPVDLPSGRTFYRRWLVRGFRGRTCLEMRLAFGPGYPEHTIHVRGSAATATVDFERNTYFACRSNGSEPDFDRYAVTTGAGRALVRQARGTLARYVLSKLKLARDGSPFGGSIRRSLASFYGRLPREPDPRLAPRFGLQVVRLCQQVAEASGMRMEMTSPPPPVIKASAPDVLILGGTGFIGQAVVRQLVEAGRRVRLLARDPAGLPRSLRGLPLEVIGGDLADVDLEPALKGIDCVYHLARSRTARTWDDYLSQDLAPTMALAEACVRVGIRRLIYTGTIDSYFTGNSRDVIDERTPLDPRIDRRNLYARSKARAERSLLDLRSDRGLPVVIFRPGIVIGPGGSPYHWGVAFWRSDSFCRFWGDGTNMLPFVLADDVARGLVLAVDAEGIDGKSFNLVSDSCLNARDYVAALADATRTRIDAAPMPAWRTYLGELGKWVVKCVVRHPSRRLPSYRDWQTHAHLARFDCSEARRVLGWSSQVGRDQLIEEGVRKTVKEWLEGGH